MAKGKDTIAMRDKNGNIANPIAKDADTWRKAGWVDVKPVAVPKDDAPE